MFFPDHMFIESKFKKKIIYPCYIHYCEWFDTVLFVFEREHNLSQREKT